MYKSHNESAHARVHVYIAMAQSSKDATQDSADRKDKIKVRLYIEKEVLDISRGQKSLTQIHVTYDQTPPHAFVSKLRKFVMESNADKCLERFHVSLEWQEAMDQQPAAKRKRKLSSMCNDANTVCCIFAL